MPKYKISSWWGAPENLTDKKKERKISWLELFYDLVYVAVIAQLTGHFAEHPNLAALLQFVFLFTIIIWSWMNGSTYHDLHGNNDNRTKYFTLLQMLAVAAVAITIKDYFNGYHLPLAISLSIIQAIITFLWYSTGYYDPSHKPLSFFYILNYCIALGLYLASIFTSLEIANLLWLIAIPINLSPAILSNSRTKRLLAVRGMNFTLSAAMVERYGLFTIIVLGECVVGVTHGIASLQDKDIWAWLFFMIAIFICFIIWWIYFDILGDREAKPGHSNYICISLLNFPLIIALAGFGTMLKVLLEEAEHLYYTEVKWMFCISLSIFLLSINFISRFLLPNHSPKPLTDKLCTIITFCAILISCLPLIKAESISNMEFLTTIAILLFVPILYSIIFSTKNNLYPDKNIGNEKLS